MAYSNFTIARLIKDFALKIESRPQLFRDVASREISDDLTRTLTRNVPLAVAIGTEKARSELIIAPILVELREQANQQISLFSGVDFTVDAVLGLNGVCDFLLSRSPQQFTVESPVIVLVEAKNDDFKIGLPQCIAEMIAAQIFNEREKSEVKTIFGVVTTGSGWQFLRLNDKLVEIGTEEYLIQQPQKILGVLWEMIQTQN